MLIVNDWKAKRAQIKKEISKQFNHSSSMMTTDISGVVLNSSGQNSEDIKKMLQKIGQSQEPTKTYARHDIISFKLRKGQQTGWKLTLRKERAWSFLFNLFNFVLANTRDFKGLSVKGFDQGGNYNLGIKDCSSFPETPSLRLSLQVTVIFSGKNTEENKAFLDKLGSPF